MAVRLLTSDRENLVQIFLQNDLFRDNGELRSLVDSAFGFPGGDVIKDNIEIKGAPRPAVSALVLFLEEHAALPDGREPLVVFLDSIANLFGDAQDFFDELKEAFPVPAYRADNSPARAGPLPDLVYYEVDHVPQVERIRQELPNRASPVPLVCVVKGDWAQAPDKLLERLKSIILPKTFGLESLQLYALAWPDANTRIEDMPGQFTRKLAREVFKEQYDPSQDRQAIQSRLAHQAAMVYTSVATDSYATGPEGLQKYLEFWEDWPELAPTQRLFVYLFVEAKPAEKGGLFSIFTRSPQEKLDRFLERIQTEPGRRSSRLVLPPLHGARKQHASDWIQRSEVSSRCEVGRVQLELSRYYELPGGKDREFAPVLELVDHLKAWMTAYPRQSNGG